MQIQVRSSNGITLVPIESSLLFSRRIVFLEGSIDTETAGEFIRTILMLNVEDREKEINVLINTPGGTINAGMCVYDAIQTSIAPVRLFCVGKAYSMGAILLASGKHGRFSLPNSEIMIHEPLLGGEVSGSSSSIKSISDSLLETKNKMNRILAKHTGKSEEEIEKQTDHDHYFTPQEAIDFGLLDDIVGLDQIIGGC